MKIKSIKSIEILDSRGKPTIRTFVQLEDGSMHKSSVPSGASTGAHEAVELRDGDPRRHLGQGVLNAVKNVNDLIAPNLIGLEASDIEKIDAKMIEIDGSDNKGRLGANAILSVSMACAIAHSTSSKTPLWRFLHEKFFPRRQPDFPRLMVNIVNGGKHASWNFDIQEFMIVAKSNKPSVSTRLSAEVFQQLGKLIKKQKLSTLVGDEGGYSPALSSNEAVLGQILEATQIAGYKNTIDFGFALDCAATEFYKDGKYTMQKTGETLTPDQLINFYKNIGDKYNIESFEDPFAEDDWSAWQKFTAETNSKYIIVGDDLLVTNPKRIERGIREKSANAVLIKLNQIGTITETVRAIRVAQDSRWKIAVSHRSGETEDNFISDLAYACGAEFIKTGSMSRSDRLSKYNRLLEIEAGM
jgi:enolase